MPGRPIKIGIVCPGARLEPEMAARVTALSAAAYGAVAELVFHPQCFLSSGHFAGTDAERAEALVAMANDPEIDAVWFGRGGYGGARIAEAALRRFAPVARQKTYLGYSDAGSLLAALYRGSWGRPVHGPMPADIKREGGEAAVLRSLKFLIEDGREGVEPSAVSSTTPVAAFNLTILGMLMGTPLEPDLAGHILMLEEVSEHHYRIDRMMFHLTSQKVIHRLAGIRLGRCSLIPPNDPEFGATPEEIVRHWCRLAGIPYLGAADIGHDADNKIVPFGRPATA